MTSPQPSPDLALLAAGWERNAETDEYRRLGRSEWMSHDAARALAFPPEPPAAKPDLPPIDADTHRTVAFLHACADLAGRYGFRSTGYTFNVTQSPSGQPILSISFVIEKDPLL